MGWQSISGEIMMHVHVQSNTLFARVYRVDGLVATGYVRYNKSLGSRIFDCIIYWTYKKCTETVVVASVRIELLCT